MTKKVEDFLRSDEAGLEAKDRNNLQFYLAMYLAAKLTGSPNPTIPQIAKVFVDSISDKMMKDCLNVVKHEYEELGGSDQVAKGTALLGNLKQRILSGVTAA